MPAVTRAGPRTTLTPMDLHRSRSILLPAVLSIALVAGGGSTARGQTPTPNPAPPPAPAQQPPATLGASEPKPAASDELLPGVLPADTSPEARAAWAKLLKALAPETAEAAARIDSFDLSIHTRVMSRTDTGAVQPNDFKARYRYLGPGFVRTTLLSENLDRMRGPDGDWLLDPKKADAVKLAGEDFAQDRRELGQTLSLARNYLALAEPAQLRIRSLKLLAAPPAGLPKFGKDGAPKDSALPRAAELVWLALESPDFQVVETKKSKEPPMYRVQLGLDKESGLPLLATVWQDERGAMVAETAVLVDLIGPKQFRRIDGRLVPVWFQLHDAQLPSSPFAFQPTWRASVFVMDGSRLRPKLTADDFRPKPVARN